MEKVKLIAISVLCIVIALSITYFALDYTERGNALVATNFVKNEATYKFDGMPETFKLTGTIKLECPYCWEFNFEYQSRNSGYGNRKDEVVAPVPTNHSARIVMEKGTISSAVMDDTWDMKDQKPYGSQGDQPERRR